MTLTALVKSFEGLLVARLFLGAAEAGVSPFLADLAIFSHSFV